MGSQIIRNMLGVSLIILSTTCIRAQSIKVTLLGTGTPKPSFERFGPSTLVEAGAEKLLFDCGRGSTLRMQQLNLRPRDVTAMFLTHLHSDHIVGIPDQWLTGWLGGRTDPFRICGPAGTKEMMANLEKAYKVDIHFRIEYGKRDPKGATLLAEDVTEGVVYEKDEVKVTAFLVDHGPVVKPALGYRIDYRGRSVVISGDTRFSENLIAFSKGVDLLIHEVAVAKEELLSKSEGVRKIIAYHTTPEEAGRAFGRVKPGLALYSHIALPSDSTIGEPTVQDLIALTRKTYAGPLEVGEDLMTIEVGDKIEVHRYTPAKEFQAMMAKVDAAQLELQNGRAATFKALWSHADDVTLSGGFGGAIEKGWAQVSRRLDWVGEQFSKGTNTIDRIVTNVNSDLAYVVQLEHIRFHVPGQAKESTRDYRVTMAFRHESEGWRIVHRQADSQMMKQAPQ